MTMKGLVIGVVLGRSPEHVVGIDVFTAHTL
jgi:hypothetical protein